MFLEDLVYQFANYVISHPILTLYFSFDDPEYMNVLL